MAFKVDRDTAGRFAFYDCKTLSWWFFSNTAITFIVDVGSGAAKITWRSDSFIFHWLCVNIVQRACKNIDHIYVRV